MCARRKRFSDGKAAFGAAVEPAGHSVRREGSWQEADREFAEALSGADT